VSVSRQTRRAPPRPSGMAYVDAPIRAEIRQCANPTIRLYGNAQSPATTRRRSRAAHRASLPIFLTHATKKAKRYRYYVSASLLAGDHPQAQKGMRVPAGDVEALVLDRLRALLSSRTDVSETLAPLDLDAYALDAALRKALKLSERWLATPPVALKALSRK